MSTGARVNEIDLLRFLAALSVVLFHYGFNGHAMGLSALALPELSAVARYGYLGVELFFMISGFVILMTAGGGSLRGFVVSRITRLYPAFWACCTLTFVAGRFLGDGRPELTATPAQYLVNLTMLSGYLGVPSVDGAYWSLFIEMNFYALVSLVLLAGRIHQAQRFLVLWLALTLVLTAYPSWTLRFIFAADYAAYFIGGATCYLVWLHGLSAARAALLLASWALGLYESLRLLPGMEQRYGAEMSPLVVALGVTACFAVMLLVALRRTGFMGRRRWQMAGVLTYPLYLLHENIGFMIFNAAVPAGVNRWALLAVTVAAMLLLAWAVHALVEKPLARRMKPALDGLFDGVQRRWPVLAGRAAGRRV
jgi:peptidoglycan/LPS O-acetylase OafA/YrhL